MNLKRLFPVGISLAALLGVIAVPAAASSTTATSAPASVRPANVAPRLPAGVVRLGAPDPDTHIDFEIVLASSHPRALASLLAELYDPHSPRYQHWLAPGEYQRRFGPNANEVQAVTAWLRHVGLPDSRFVGNTLQVDATTHAIAHAFGIAFRRYRLANGVTRLAPEQAPLVPASIASNITTIVGLSDTTPERPHHALVSRPGSINPRTPSRAGACGTSVQEQANALGGWTTRQIDASYKVNGLTSAGFSGAGETIALFELAPHTSSDTSAYLACFGLHNRVATTAVDGGPHDSNPDGAVEANLDIEAAAATAPDANIVSYEGPNTARGALDVWAAIVHDDTAQAISTSWGMCETLDNPADRNAMHALFMQAAAQGQTIFAASGDNGSEDCFQESGSNALAVDSPADDPLVTAVGGTAAQPNVALTKPAHEPAWNDCLTAVNASCAFEGGAGGGGVSHAYAKPTWQPLAADSTCLTSCREVPDISANAGVGEAFISGGQWQLIGGTSIAAPKLAGIAADIASGCTTPLGALNPKLYALANTGAYGIALHDVPAGQGNNDLSRDQHDHYQTATGYDLATGLGTPIATGLACPEITSVKPPNAPAGSTVTITGLALSRATITFGNTPAQVLSATTTSATVIVPNETNDAQVSASDQIGNGRDSASFAQSSVRPD